MLDPTGRGFPTLHGKVSRMDEIFRPAQELDS